VAATLTTEALRRGLSAIADGMEACADELNTVDGALGDGDLGVTMVRGVRSLREELPDLPDDVGMAFSRCARALVRVSGSTFGTLLATGLMSAARATRGRTEVACSETSALLQAAIQAMSERGKAKLGDKTVLDAAEAVRVATEGVDDPAQLLAAAKRAVADALDRYRDRPCQQGRARIFGDASIGRDDPGMVAFARMVESLG